MIRLDGIPVIETARLRLRGPRIEDFEANAAFLASDRARYVGGPVGRTLAWRGFCHMTGHWVHRDFSMFVIADRQSDAALSICGPCYPEGWPEPELGWSIWEPKAEGKGIAFEATIAARRFVCETLGWTTAISLIVEGNTRSEALARRMGATCEGTFEHEVFGKSLVYRHPGPEGLA